MLLCSSVARALWCTEVSSRPKTFEKPKTTKLSSFAFHLNLSKRENCHGSSDEANAAVGTTERSTSQVRSNISAFLFYKLSAMLSLLILLFLPSPIGGILYLHQAPLSLSLSLSVAPAGCLLHALCSGGPIAGPLMISTGDASVPVERYSMVHSITICSCSSI